MSGLDISAAEAAIASRQIMNAHVFFTRLLPRPRCGIRPAARMQVPAALTLIRHLYICRPTDSGRIAAEHAGSISEGDRHAVTSPGDRGSRKEVLAVDRRRGH